MLGSFNVGAIGPYFQSFSEATGTAARLLKVIDRKTPIDATNDEGEKLSVVEGHIRLENIRHIYPSRPEVTVMDGVSLDIPAGKVTALVGASGSGKSTIIGLVERFYNPIGGSIYLDGTDINTLNIRWLRQQIGLVGQEPILFAVSILENIRYGLIGTDYEDASEASQKEMIVEAAKKANAHEFISQLSDGYETNVGQRGFLLSGGQKQRVAIARAIVSNPKSKSDVSANIHK
jgi:ATP-binding cassette, subfamily B (MDR/TAP), member 1